ncbi:amidohydrolase [Flavobacterium sp. NG2]|uniref:amidohydrolase n=1 Tax=Flavobacterium sp. NG2 TaxID=3097547 RepID=UPI002A8061F6|nr:amidohydrolase [Flavobacterium sp. NG2]WPR71871.1 amidohydrolase [Flavobacterium sp. NG2]
MKIALLQSPLIWENPKANRIAFEEKINAIASDIELIVLPEMFTTGFTMNPERVAETMRGETVQWMQSLAKAKTAAITGSVVIEENGNYYNRILFVYPSGEVQHYNKRHLFTLAGEEKIYTAGKEKLIVDYLGWKICLMVCYDLRFPVFSRNSENYDVLIYVANWPESRILAWDSLLRARAIENLCYTIGVNRVQNDANALNYNGHSQLIDSLGNYIVSPQEEEGVFISEIDQAELIANRKKFNFLNDADSFEIKD